ncbi:MAG TPA: hypothetical protein VJQ46_14805 [Gemmatimonadales bacterium]|nr:hypothetical protein [Gemmatimonadales bacterium]
MHRSLLLCLLLAGRPAAARAQVELQGFFGSSVSLPSPLTITQEGERDLHFTAHWATRPFLDTWYYAGRIGVWSGNRGWLFDFTHHKIYLTNGPNEVQKFRITNGLNLFTVSRGFRRGRFSYAIGAGPVITFPINRVRGRKLSGRGFWGGYLLSGANLMASATRQFPLTRGIFFSLDGRLSATYVSVPVDGGHASVPNVALHFHAGLGYSIGGGARKRDAARESP